MRSQFCRGVSFDSPVEPDPLPGDLVVVVAVVAAPPGPGAVVAIVAALGSLNHLLKRSFMRSSF